MHTIRTFVLVAVVFFGFTSQVSAATIVDIASGDSKFSSLVDAVVSQDLAGTLSGTGPFTVFAPTNDAFSDLPGYIGDILKKEPELLTDILLYHVVADELVASEVLASKRIKTVQGESLRVNMRAGSPHVDSSKITATDITASNGVIHVIDRVLIPNKVYHAVIADLRHQLREIALTMRDVRVDQASKAR